jgi:hypothetical protein
MGLVVEIKERASAERASKLHLRPNPPLAPALKWTPVSDLMDIAQWSVTKSNRLKSLAVWPTVSHEKRQSNAHRVKRPAKQQEITVY